MHSVSLYTHLWDMNAYNSWGTKVLYVCINKQQIAQRNVA